MSEAILPKQKAHLFEFFEELHREFVEPFENSVNEQLAIEESQLCTLAEYVSDGEALEKRDRLARFIEQLEAEEKLHGKRAQAEAAKARLAARIKEIVCNGLTSVMGNKGVRRVNGETYSFTRVKNTPGVEVTDETLLPRETCSECGTVHGQFWSVTSAVSFQRIKDALQSGENVPGAKLKEDKFHLLIR